MQSSTEEFVPVPPAIAETIRRAGRHVAAKGWVPAMSGNLSHRLDLANLAITISAVDTGSLAADQVVSAPIYGTPPQAASSETRLHQLVYRKHAETGAVVHVHSIGATLVSRRFAGSGEVIFEGYEILKAFADITTHEISLRIPIFANSQDIPALAEKVERRLEHYPRSPGFLIAGHGLYAWGGTMADALRHAEAFDFLFSCQLVPGGYAL